MTTGDASSAASAAPAAAAAPIAAAGSGANEGGASGGAGVAAATAAPGAATAPATGPTAAAGAPADSATGFIVEAVCGAARVGSWLSLKTPTLLVSTHCGAVPHLSPALVRSIPFPLGLAVRLGHVLGLAPIVAASGAAKLTAYINAPPTASTFLTIRDPAHHEDIPTNDTHASVESVGGRHRLTPKDFMKVVNQLKPDAFVAMCDERPQYTPSSRVSKAVTSSSKFLKECVAGNACGAAVIAPVIGSTYPQLLGFSAKHVAGSVVQGISVASLGLGAPEPGSDLTSFRQAVAATQPQLPRFVVGIDSPVDMIEFIRAGADVFDSSYPLRLCDAGYALTFAIDEAAQSADLRAASPPPGDGSKIAIRDRRFEDDQKPLLPGCGCYACTHHTRAYVHHLVMTHELLGLTLLYMHNLYHMLAFFDVVRREVAAGRLDAYTEWFQRKWHEEDAA